MTKKAYNSKQQRKTHIAIVGPCGSGKSTLANSLKVRGYDARQIAQEHSYVARMWQVLTAPDILIYLDVTYQPGTRRKQLNWNPGEFDEQVRRLVHARQHCDIYIHTDHLTEDEVLNRVLEQL
jgi:thymidylate kinase